MQLSYSNTPDIGFAGMAVDAGPKDVVTGLNEEALDASVGFGVGVVQGDADEGFLLPDEDGLMLKAVTLHEHRGDNSLIAGVGAIPAGGTAPLLRKGRLFVLTEDAVDAGAKAFCRHTSDGGSNTQLGKFRSDNDGVAQVTTVTPTSAHSTKFGLLITIDGRLYRLEYTSDSASNDEEICDGFRAALLANTALAALIAGTGTTTLILTAIVPGVAFEVVADGSAGVFTSIVTGTPASTKAFETPCVFRSSTSGAGLAELEVNLP